MMKSILKKLKLFTKIASGFSVVILLLLIVSFVSWSGINTISNGFTEYRRLARDTNLAGRLQANMLMIRMNVKDFIITQNDKDKEQYNAYFEKMSTFLIEAEREIKNPKRAGILKKYSNDVLIYDKAFTEVVDEYEKRDQLVNEVLNKIGPSMEKNLTSIMESAKQDSDAEAACEAGIALRHMLLGRLYVQKFLGTNNLNDHDRVDLEFKLLIEKISSLELILENPERKKLNANVRRMSEQYLKSFDQVAASIDRRNHIIASKLDSLGPIMAKAVEEVKLSVKKDQDILGPMVQRKSKTIMLIMILVSSVATLVAIWAALLISKMIVDPIKKVGRFVAILAEGDFTASISLDSEDEIGNMVEALSEMGGNLRDGFKSIKEGVQSMASSTTELSAISTQLSGNAEQSSQFSNSVAAATEQTSQSMTTVAASVEEMSTSLRSVATASEEMTATIEEIAKNTEKGRVVTQTAVSKVNTASKQMNELGQAAKLIGNITDTIKGISEQTNLLALNATIEAASAGEAGKGFSVVANEIKELSRQTAKATEQISESINNIQQTTEISITEISGIVEVIEEIDQITSMIASSVEEQSNTSTEIASNVSLTADGIQEISANVNQVNEVSGEAAKNINQVQQTSNEIASASIQLNTSASELSEFAEKLNEISGKYKV